jgi:hypothetical protein
MTDLLSPDAVLAVIAIATFVIALTVLAVGLAVRESRRRAAHRALAAAHVPDAASAMCGEPYRALNEGLTAAIKEGTR